MPQKTTVHISYNTTRPSNRRSSYNVKIDASMPEDQITNSLTQIGPNYNNTVHYVGVFKSKRAAYDAVQAYLGNAE